MKEFYKAEDIQKVIDCSKAKAYQVLQELNKKFEKEYPEAITIKGRIPIWYFEKKMLMKGTDEDDKSN